ncbi:MAG: alpha/beta hydrolase [Candidatus Methylumidiphilus sp.]
MKKVLGICICLSMFWLSACSTSSFDPAKRLVIAPAERIPISSIDQVLGGLFEHKKPFVLYVHGRGDEPKKTEQGKILEKLEQQYGVKVLMFNWDSKAKFVLSRPVAHADEAAPYLSDVVAKIINYRKLHQEARSIPISLLVHSMGNIVLQQAIDKDLKLSESDGPLFMNILMTGSDADAEGHNLWVEKLSAKGEIMITINKQDGTLSWSKHDSGKTPLGINPKEPLAKNAHYLNVTGLVGKTHRLFQKGRQHGQISICLILTSMLRSETPNLQLGKLVNGGGDDRILVPIANIDNSNSCFAAFFPTDPDLDPNDEE